MDLPAVIPQQQSLAVGTGFWRIVTTEHGIWRWILLVNWAQLEKRMSKKGRVLNFLQLQLIDMQSILLVK